MFLDGSCYMPKHRYESRGGRSCGFQSKLIWECFFCCAYSSNLLSTLVLTFSLSCCLTTEPICVTYWHLCFFWFPLYIPLTDNDDDVRRCVWRCVYLQGIMPGPPFAFGAILVILALIVALFIPENPHSHVKSPTTRHTPPLQLELEEELVETSTDLPTASWHWRPVLWQCGILAERSTLIPH